MEIKYDELYCEFNIVTPFSAKADQQRLAGL